MQFDRPQFRKGPRAQTQDGSIIQWALVSWVQCFLGAPEDSGRGCRGPGGSKGSGGHVGATCHGTWPDRRAPKLLNTTHNFWAIFSKEFTFHLHFNGACFSRKRSGDRVTGIRAKFHGWILFRLTRRLFVYSFRSIFIRSSESRCG